MNLSSLVPTTLDAATGRLTFYRAAPTPGLPDPSKNPPPPPGWRYIPQAQVTAAMTAWAVKLLGDDTDWPGPPPYWDVPGVVDGVALRALVQSHVPDPQNGAVHRGVSLCVPADGSRPAEGADLSHYQGDAVDFQKARASGVSFCFLKASEGTAGVDQSFARNWQASRDAGLPRGGYHFFHPSFDGAQQAADFLRVLSSVATPAELAPVIDVETFAGTPRGLAELPPEHKRGLASLLALTAPNFAANLGALLDVVQKTMPPGQLPTIYTSPGFWSQLPPAAQALAARANLWVAHWGVAAPALPTGWKNWLFWQYSATTAIPGVPGPMDADRLNGTATDLAALVGAPPVPAPPPTPSPSPDLGTVRGVQLALAYLAVKLHDPLLDPGGVDGVEGPRTDAALMRLQQQYAKVTDAGPRTRAALQALLDKTRGGP